jgi:hypothetical protein
VKQFGRVQISSDGMFNKFTAVLSLLNVIRIEDRCYRTSKINIQIRVFWYVTLCAGGACWFDERSLYCYKNIDGRFPRNVGIYLPNDRTLRLRIM